MQNGWIEVGLLGGRVGRTLGILPLIAKEETKFSNAGRVK